MCHLCSTVVLQFRSTRYRSVMLSLSFSMECLKPAFCSFVVLCCFFTSFVDLFSKVIVPFGICFYFFIFFLSLWTILDRTFYTDTCLMTKTVRYYLGVSMYSLLTKTTLLSWCLYVQFYFLIHNLEASGVDWLIDSLYNGIWQSH